MSATAFTAACVQMNSGTDVARNMVSASKLIREAASQGAHYVQTPEMTTIVEQNRRALEAAIHPEANNPTVQAFSDLARDLGIWLHIGSMAVALEPTDSGPSIANRAFLFQPDGQIAASYDKIHMYDVDLDNGETWRESKAYRPGENGILADINPNSASIRIGLSICYDLRFADLFRSYAKQGATLLGAPSAFTKQTGEAHWHVLQRARAIEHGAFMVSAAQAGNHEDGRETFGHSMIVDPWGTILAEANGTDEMVITAEIQPDLAATARRKIPALVNDRVFQLQPISQGAAT